MFKDAARVRMDAALGPSRGKQTVHADLKLTPALSGQVKLTSIAFAPFRGFVPQGIDAIVRQGTVTFDGDVSQNENQAFSVAGNARLADLSLRDRPASAKMHLNGSLDPRSQA